MRFILVHLIGFSDSLGYFPVASQDLRHPNFGALQDGWTVGAHLLKAKNCRSGRIEGSMVKGASEANQDIKGSNNESMAFCA